MDPSGSGQISNSKNNDKNKDNNINNNPSSSSSQPPIFLPESSNLRSLNTTTSNEWVWTPYPPEPAMNLSWLNMNDEPFEYEYERFSDFDPRRDDHDQHIIVDQRQTSTEQQQVADNEGACASSKDDDQKINMRKWPWKTSEEQTDPAANYYYYPIYLTSSSSVPPFSTTNASNKNVDDDEDEEEEEEEEEEEDEDEDEDEEEEQMVPPRHIRKLVYDLQNMYRYHGVEEDEQDGVLLENPFAYEKLRDDHMPYLKKFETVQKEREEAAAAAAAAAASSFGRRPNYHYSSSAPHPHPPYPHAQYPPYQQARERDPDYRPSSSRDSKRTVRIKRTINPEDPSQPPIISFQRNRKKPGCACSKSKCVKNLCGCVVLETGCNAKCRCTDCENPFGRKPGKVPKGRPPKLIIKRGTNIKE